jgi:MFS family permease
VETTLDMDVPASAAPSRPRRAAALKRNLRFGVFDGTLYSVMIGAGETYLAPFVLAAGLGAVASGLVTTVPFLAGAVLQLIAPWGVRRVGTLRRWVVLTATLQSLSLIPLAIMALVGHVSLGPVYAAAMFYWAASMGCGAGWTTFITGIVPSRIRAHYFAFKARFGHVATMASLAGAGLILDRFATPGTLWPYAILFLVAAAARAGSAYFLHRHSDTGPVPPQHRYIGPAELIGRFRAGRDGHFMLYMMLVQVAVQIGQAFYSPFMLEQLRLGYGQYLALTGAAFVARAATQSLWGSFAHRYGPGALLWIGGLGIIPHSALWLVSPSFAYLLAMQLFAGAMWSAYELATLLLLFENLRAEERTSLYSIFNAMNASAMVVGSVVGGALLGAHPDWSAYEAIFLLSLAARLGTVAFLRRRRAITHPLPIPSKSRPSAPAPAPSIGRSDLVAGGVPAPSVPSCQRSPINARGLATPAPAPSRRVGRDAPRHAPPYHRPHGHRPQRPHLRV